MGNVGGDPASMSGGALTIHQAAANFKATHHDVSAGVHAAAAAAGADNVAASARRLAAALGAVLDDTAVQVDLTSRLAANAAEDLRRAGGR